MSTSGTDFTRPNVARVYDYLLGGYESFAADREQSADLLRIFPPAGVAAFENRYFLARAVTWAAGQGLTQFVDPKVAELGIDNSSAAPTAQVEELHGAQRSRANESAMWAYSVRRL